MISKQLLFFLGFSFFHFTGICQNLYQFPNEIPESYKIEPQTIYNGITNTDHKGVRQKDVERWLSPVLGYK